MFQLIQYVLTAAIRDRLIVSFFLLIAIGVSLGLFFGSAALIEQDQFSIVFSAGGLRLAGMAALVLFVVFYIRRSFDQRDVDYLLSRPVGRVTFLLSHAAAISVLAILMAIAITIAVSVMVPSAFTAGHLFWGASLIVEYMIMVNVALFFSMVLASASASAIICFAFYVLARLMGQILGIVYNSASSELFQILGKVMEVISIVIPRLDLMGQTSWLLYGANDEINYMFLAVQGLFFTVLILIAALIDLIRRQF